MQIDAPRRHRGCGAISGLLFGGFVADDATHGGASTGYPLHLSSGKLIWAVRHGKTLTTTQTDYPADNQRHRITATLAKNGQLSLQLDQNASTTANSPGLISNQPKEDFCLGHDNKVPVATYTAKGKFEGKINRLAIGLGLHH